MDTGPGTGAGRGGSDCGHVWVADDPPVGRDVWWSWTAEQWDDYWRACRWWCVKRCGAERIGRG